MIDLAYLKVIYEAAPIRLPQLFASLMDIAARIWQNGWAEANAGNISIKITQALKDVHLVRENDPTHYFLVSRSGSRYRQMAHDAMEALVLIAINEQQELIYPAGARPTSEWSSHKLLQQRFILNGSGQNVVLHCHPAEMIALSQLPIYREPERLKELLYRILPEMKYYFPAGLAFAPYEEPGSQELADVSIACMQNCKALIWQAHGVLSFGENLDEAFDYLEIICKAAKVFFLLNPKP